ncbi:MAG: outer membrane beta-barrel protein [Gammaproteobacteria bacterium]|nr:outer membrane beta-barrel protein [Gammaproteobacteria bacterium]
MKRCYSKRSLLVAMVFLVGGYVSPVFAAPSFGDEKRWYAGVGVSASDLTFNEANLSAMYSDGSDASFRQGGDTFKLFAGYQFDPLLGIELGVTSFGEIVMDTDLSQRNVFTANALYLNAVITQPVLKNIDLQAKFGMSFWSLMDNDDNEIESGQGLTYGVGMNIDLYGSDERTLLIEWERYNFSGVALQEADSMSASIKFRF